jgi:hypothetical protein
MPRSFFFFFFFFLWWCKRVGINHEMAYCSLELLELGNFFWRGEISNLNKKYVHVLIVSLNN